MIFCLLFFGVRCSSSLSSSLTLRCGPFDQFRQLFLSRVCVSLFTRQKFQFLTTLTVSCRDEATLHIFKSVGRSEVTLLSRAFQPTRSYFWRVYSPRDDPLIVSKRRKEINQHSKKRKTASERGATENWRWKAVYRTSHLRPLIKNINQINPRPNHNSYLLYVSPS